MSIELLAIPIHGVVFAEAGSPDDDHGFVFEHLVHYFSKLSKLEQLPAISIEIREGKAVVVRGHIYLLAARALGRDEIRAVVMGKPTAEEVRLLVVRTNARILDWGAIQAEEDRDPNPMAWHVFYFERALSAAEKAAFDEAVHQVFTDEPRVTHDDAGPLAELEAWTPVGDEAWASKNLATFLTFAHEHVGIVTFQGRRFPRPARD